MHRIYVELGWPGVAAVVLLATLSVPTFVRWLRFEITLARRVRRYEQRAKRARAERVNLW